MAIGALIKKTVTTAQAVAKATTPAAKVAVMKAATAPAKATPTPAKAPTPAPTKAAAPAKKAVVPAPVSKPAVVPAKAPVIISPAPVAKAVTTPKTIAEIIKAPMEAMAKLKAVQAATERAKTEAVAKKVTATELKEYQTPVVTERKAGLAEMAQQLADAKAGKIPANVILPEFAGVMAQQGSAIAKLYSADALKKMTVEQRVAAVQQIIKMQNPTPEEVSHILPVAQEKSPVALTPTEEEKTLFKQLFPEKPALAGPVLPAAFLWYNAPEIINLGAYLKEKGETGLSSDAVKGILTKAGNYFYANPAQEQTFMASLDKGQSLKLAVATLKYGFGARQPQAADPAMVGLAFTGVGGLGEGLIGWLSPSGVGFLTKWSAMAAKLIKPKTVIAGAAGALALIGLHLTTEWGAKEAPEMLKITVDDAIKRGDFEEAEKLLALEEIAAATGAKTVREIAWLNPITRDYFLANLAGAEEAAKSQRRKLEQAKAAAKEEAAKGNKAWIYFKIEPKDVRFVIKPQNLPGQYLMQFQAPLGHQEGTIEAPGYKTKTWSTNLFTAGETVTLQYTLQKEAAAYVAPAPTPEEEEAAAPVVPTPTPAKPTPTPTEKPPNYGTLVVTSVPEAIITIAGYPEQETLATFHLPPGSYDVRADVEGYAPKIKSTYVSANDTSAISFTLTQLEISAPVIPSAEAYRVDMTGEPTGTKISVNGTFTGKYLPDYVVLRPGNYTFSFEKSGYYPYYTTREIPGD